MAATATFLMFSGRVFGKAKEAMSFYVSLFEDSRIDEIEYYVPGDEAGRPGTVKMAVFTLAGQEYRAGDGRADHASAVTPPMSVYARCRTVDEIDRICAALADGGSTLMPLGDYGFSPKFAWVLDRYGVSWQLDLAERDP
jgi:predicted 3-demethylubiquinone-9 3-methyltransferase (glyoxalase superfamily)